MQTVTQSVGSYAEHARLMEKMTRIDANAAGWRGCAGLALILRGVVQPPDGDNGQGFMKNDDLTWVTGTDIPVPWMKGLPRTAHLFQTRKAVLRYGKPILDVATITKEFDYWDGPADLNLPEEVVLAANGINNAMTSTAFSYRYTWVPHTRVYADWAGGKPAVLLGAKRYDPAITRETSWIPKPWVTVDPRKAELMFQRLRAGDYNDTFKAVVIDLFSAGMPVTSPVAGYYTGTSPLLSGGVPYTQFNFRESNGAKHAIITTAGARSSSQKGMPVSRGTQVGRDAPPVSSDFYNWSYARQWNYVVRTYQPEVLNLVLGNVFSALFRKCGESWLVPYGVLGTDITYSLSRGELWWDVSNVMTDTADFSVPEDPRVHIMPTLRMDSWDNFKQMLGDTSIDLIPADPLFRAYAMGRQIRRPFVSYTTGKTGYAEGEVIPVAVAPGQPTGVMPSLPDAFDDGSWEE